MPRQHCPTYTVTDVGNGIARGLSQGHAGGESVSVPGKTKILLLKICDHTIAHAVSASRGDSYGKFRQDCPKFVCARRIVRMKRANSPLFGQFLRDRPRRGEIENKNLKSAQQAPNGVVIVRRPLFTKMRPKSVRKSGLASLAEPGRLMRLMKVAASPNSCARVKASW